MPTYYGDKSNWLAAPAEPEKKADVFFAYPTAWRARAGEYPVSSIDNPDMRHWAKQYLATRASVFESCANIYAPYYRQLDTAYALSKGAEAEKYYGVPGEDILASFAYYIEKFNRGRSYILAGHSQGSIMLRRILFTYMRSHPDVYQRMIAAYAVGVPFTDRDYKENPHLRAAVSAGDVGVVISYNTEAPGVTGLNPLSVPGAVTINPISWTTDSAWVPADESLGSLIVQPDGTMKKIVSFADARICPERGTIICSTASPSLFGSQGESTAYFPHGVLHESDFSLYYFDLRANAELRIQRYLETSL